MSFTAHATRCTRTAPSVVPLITGLLAEVGLRLAYADSPVLGQRLCEAHGGLALLTLLAVVAARCLHLLPYRRLLGLSACGFTLLHLGYAHVEVFGGAADGVLFLSPDEQIGVAMGGLAALGLLPLALTSTGAARRRLGHHWTTLHAITPALLLLAAAHALMSGVHAGRGLPAVLVTAGVTAALLSRSTHRKVPT